MASNENSIPDLDGENATLAPVDFGASDAVSAQSIVNDDEIVDVDVNIDTSANTTFDHDGDLDVDVEAEWEQLVATLPATTATVEVVHSAPLPLNAQEPEWECLVKDELFPEGTVHEGTIHEGTIHEGTVHEGTVHEGTVHEGTVDLNLDLDFSSDVFPEINALLDHNTATNIPFDNGMQSMETTAEVPAESDDDSIVLDMDWLGPFSTVSIAGFERNLPTPSTSYQIQAPLQEQTPLGTGMTMSDSTTVNTLQRPISPPLLSSFASIQTDFEIEPEPVLSAADQEIVDRLLESALGTTAASDLIWGFEGAGDAMLGSDVSAEATANNTDVSDYTTSGHAMFDTADYSDNSKIAGGLPGFDTSTGSAFDLETDHVLDSVDGLTPVNNDSALLTAEHANPSLLTAAHADQTTVSMEAIQPEPKLVLLPYVHSAAEDQYFAMLAQLQHNPLAGFAEYVYDPIHPFRLTLKMQMELLLELLFPEPLNMELHEGRMAAFRRYFHPQFTQEDLSDLQELLLELTTVQRSATRIGLGHLRSVVDHPLYWAIERVRIDRGLVPDVGLLEVRIWAILAAREAMSPVEMIEDVVD